MKSSEAPSSDEETAAYAAPAVEELDAPDGPAVTAALASQDKA